MNILSTLNQVDAVNWAANYYWQSATNPSGTSDAIENLAKLLQNITADHKRDQYIKSICYNISEEISKQDKEVKDLQAEANGIVKGAKKLPPDDSMRNTLMMEADELYNKAAAIKESMLTDIKPTDLHRYVRDYKPNTHVTQFTIADQAANTDTTDPDNYRKAMPKYLDQQQILSKGFCEVSHTEKGELKLFGYFSWNPAQHDIVELTNFTINPLFHIYAGSNSRYMIEVTNGRDTATLDLDKKAMVSIETMQTELVGEGNYIIFATKNQYLNIARTLLNSFKRTQEINYLGWQRDGFFAYIDVLIQPDIATSNITKHALDKWGVGNIDNNNYIIPASSDAYTKLIKREDDPYENLRVMNFKQSPITLNNWIHRMKRVFMDAGLMGVSYAIMCVYRDIIFSIDNNFPHLYFTGEKSSGKSKCAEAINAFFYNKRPFFNLNSGTDFAFFGYMSRFKGALAALNEFDEAVIKPDWFQSLKGIFDGETRQRGVMGGKKNQTESQAVDSGVLLIGQFIVTMDDNSIITRSLIKQFNVREIITEDDAREYNELLDINEAGINSLAADVVKHRAFFKANYKNTFFENISRWRQNFPANSNFNQRIVQNWCHLYTAMQVLNEVQSIPEVNLAEYHDYCYKSAQEWCNFIRNSDVLTTFWKTIEFLVEQNELIMGWDIDIETVPYLTLKGDKKTTYTHPFIQPTTVLHLRLNNAHKLYSERTKRSASKAEAISIESLIHYFKGRKYFIGQKNAHRFKRVTTQKDITTDPTITQGERIVSEARKEEKITSCYTFIFEDLNIDILSTITKEESYAPALDMPPTFGDDTHPF